MIEEMGARSRAVRGRRAARAAALLCAAALAAACSTGHGTAKRHLEAGEFDLALDAYSSILQQRPADSRAKEGLRLAREGSLGKRLIAVRLTRLGGNMSRSLEMLRQVVADENIWSVYPTGAVFSTQREETAEHAGHFADMVEGHLADGRPLAAKLFFDRYKDIFRQGKTLSRVRELDQRIRGLGREDCARLASEVTREQAYFGAFVDGYCRYWGIERARAQRHAPVNAGGSRYSSIALEGSVAGLPPGVGMGLIRERLQQSLESSPYYDARSPDPLLVRIEGRFQATNQESVVSLEHSYLEKEPYVELTEVTRKRLVPYEELVVLSSSTKKVIKRVRTEEYTEPREVTKYRQVPRKHSFIGVRYRQEVSLQLDLKADVDGHPVELGLSESDRREGVAHDVDLPAIGLRKQSRMLIEPAPWLTGRSERLREGFGDKLDGLWAGLFCKTAAGRGGLPVSESAHRCRQSRRGEDSELVIRWFKSRLGVLPGEARLAFSR